MHDAVLLLAEPGRGTQTQAKRKPKPITLDAIRDATRIPRRYKPRQYFVMSVPTGFQPDARRCGEKLANTGFGADRDGKRNTQKQLCGHHPHLTAVQKRHGPLN